MSTVLSRRSVLASLAAGALVAQQKLQGGPKNVTFIATPNGGIQPQAAVDRDGTIHLIYLYGDAVASDIGYVTKARGAAAFSSPIRVNDQAGSAVGAGAVRGARLALGGKGEVHVTWNGSGKATPRGPRNLAPMLYARLDKGAPKFTPQRNLIQTAFGLDGGGAIAADGAGRVYVAWHAPGQKDGVAVEGEGTRRVWLARSMDGGATFEREAAVSPTATGVCGCCGMGALLDGQGRLYVMYRAAKETVHRDMTLLVSQDSGKSFAASSVAAWTIGACPMSTEAMAEEKGGVVAAWETQQQVYFAAIDGRTGAVGGMTAAPNSGRNRKHPALAVNAAGLRLLVWTEGTAWKKGGTLAWSMFRDGRIEAQSGAGVSAGVAPAFGTPAAVAVDEEFLVIC